MFKLLEHPPTYIGKFYLELVYCIRTMFSDELGNHIIMLKAHSISNTCQELAISYEDLLIPDSHSSHGYSNQFEAETGYA